MKTLSIDASTESYFNSRTESLDIGNSCDTRIVDLSLKISQGYGERDLDESVFVEEVFCGDFESDVP